MFDSHALGPSIREQEIVMEREFTASRQLLFQVFTQPEHLKRWWAPPPYTLPVCTIDLRPSGIWHYCMHSPEGQDQWARAVYREIAPPEKLVYTTTFADEHANPTLGGSQHFSPPESPLSKRRIEVIEKYIRSKDAFMPSLIALERQGVAVF